MSVGGPGARRGPVAVGGQPGTGRPRRSSEAVEVARAARRLGWQTAAVVLASVLLLAAVVLGVVVRG